MADTYSNRTLTAFFDERDDAEEAVAELRQLGISDASIRMVGGDQAASYSSSSSSSYSSEHKGFWESLGDFFFPDDDRATYAEGLRRGGYLVTVNNISSEYYDRVLDILDDEGSVDLDQRAETWRSEGWTGSAGSSTGGYGSGTSAAPASGYGFGASAGSDRDFGDTGSGSSSTTGYSGDASGGGLGSGASFGAGGGLGSGSTTGSTDYGTTSSTGLGATGVGTTDTSLSGSTSRDYREDEVIPVVEEELRIGKRDVNLGRVRVRSYVVEQPVSEQVSLREERVHVERRPVDRPVQAGDQLFTDKVIEAEEHAEQAVVAKEARVTEEIGLRRESEERTETISDTVRHTEVEVEDDRTAEVSTTTGTSTGTGFSGTRR